ncbi:LysR substrate-binding domain-containing protein, partial [Cobetia sp.]
LANFHRDQPEIALRLVSAFWQSDFDGEQVDIELRYGQGDWPQVEAIQVGAGQERMAVVASPALSAQLTTAADLAGMTLLHAAGFAVGWRRWLVAADQLGLEKTTSTISCDTQVMTLEMARLGMGVALVHEGHFRQWLASGNGGLEQVFALTIPAEQNFWLVRSNQRPMRPTAQRVWDYLLAEPQ